MPSFKFLCRSPGKAILSGIFGAKFRCQTPRLGPYVIDITYFIGLIYTICVFEIAVLRESSLRAGKISDVQGG